MLKASLELGDLLKCCLCLVSIEKIFGLKVFLKLPKVVQSFNYLVNIIIL